MDRQPTALLAAKRDFLVPCVYHFYQRPPVLVRGEGAYLFDAEGRRYLDCFSGVTVINAGHSNPEIIEAAIDQLRRLQHTTTIYLTEPMLDLARAIAELTPAGLRRSFFCASGSEANEGALLLAALATGRHGVRLPRRRAARPDQVGHERHRPGHVADRPAPAADGPRRARARATRTACRRWSGCCGGRRSPAVIAEPVQGNGGIVVPPDDYWPELRRLCTRYGTLLIADEVQTAWNRTGRWFATAALGRRAGRRHRGQGAGQRLPDRRLHDHRRAGRPATPGPAPRPSAATWCRAAAALATLRFHQRARLWAGAADPRGAPAGPAARAAGRGTRRSPRCAAGPDDRGRTARRGRAPAAALDRRGAGSG